MRIAICWSNISGYMSACWKELAATPGVSLKVWAFKPNLHHGQAPFDHKEMLNGLDVVLLDDVQRQDGNELAKQIADFAPNTFLVAGWILPAYVGLASDRRLSKVRNKIMAIDLPWSGTVRQRVSCLLKRRYVEQFDYIWVAGERAYQYAKRLRGSEQAIRRGVYAFDNLNFGKVSEKRRSSDASPPRFLFVGRYAREKGIDVMVDAYKKYRQSTQTPWGLECCGTGPLASLLENQPGITDHGFTQPSDLPEFFKNASVLILASRYEPWGVVVAEAMGSGMPVLASSACGAAVELIADFYNGRIVQSGNVQQLARAMKNIEDDKDLLQKWSFRATKAAQGYTASMWSRRIIAMTQA